MKAIRVHRTGGPEVLTYEDVPEPVAGPGQALVRIEATGVNFIEVYQRTGAYPLPLPFIPGSEAAGVIEAVGEGVTAFQPGDRVAFSGGSGTYAERSVVPAAQLVRVPAGVSSRLAAAVMLQGMTAHYLTHDTFPLKPGDSCLVHAAAGGVGLLLCQIARRRGARVIGTTSTEAKAEMARKAGAGDVILYTRTDFVAEVKRLTGGRGVDVVYDSVGRTTFLPGFDCLRPRGMMVLFGQSSGAPDPIDPQLLNAKGSLFLTRPTLAHYRSPEELVRRARDLFGWLQEGELDVHIHAEFPLRDAAKAHAAIESRETVGKLLLIP